MNILKYIMKTIIPRFQLQKCQIILTRMSILLSLMMLAVVVL